MIDAHCHLGELERPDAALQGLPLDAIVLAVTNTPAEFDRLRRLTHSDRLRLAVGLHPGLAERFGLRDTEAFRRATRLTSYIGEVGLDFSRPRSTWGAQEAIFRHALAYSSGKVLSVHSRRAEVRVHEMLEQSNVSAAILHWYAGSLSRAEYLANAGCLFSVGPSMVRSKHGRRLIERLDPTRILVETDAPFAKVAGRAASPLDVTSVYAHLAEAWSLDLGDAIQRVRANFLDLTRRARHVSPSG